jgi:hypothetical protein
MSDDWGHYIDCPGQICGPDMIPVLENMLLAAESFYAFIGGDEPQLGKDMARTKIAIKSLKEYHEMGSD